MKKIIPLILIFILILGNTACSNQSDPYQSTDTNQSYSVPSPMSYPNYTLSESPTPEQMRATALQATKDILTIQWSPSTKISYYNVAGRDKMFLYTPETAYGGLLYSGAGSGLFQFMEYYNKENGLLEYPGDPNDLRQNLGSGCADTLLWGWSTVVNSISGGFYPSLMVQSNGYYPVGDYTYPEYLKNFNYYPTKRIVEDNGADLILDAYTKVLPADALISSTTDHALMVAQAPVVKYLEDGTIDTKNSYVPIYEQRGGNSDTNFFEVVEEGQTVHYTGRTGFNFSFYELLYYHYIPVTCAEFLGLKEYEKPVVSTSNDNCKSLSDLLNTDIESNYPLAVINIIATDRKGNETNVDKILFSGAKQTGVPKTYNLGDSKKLQGFQASGFKKIKVEVVISTGERFIPIDFKL